MPARACLRLSFHGLQEVLDRSNDDGNCLFLHQLVKTSLNAGDALPSCLVTPCDDVAVRKRYEEDSNINIM